MKSFLPILLLGAVEVLPALEFTLAPPPPVAVGAEARYTVDVPAGAEVAWDFGDGAELPFAPAAPVSHRFASPGRQSLLVRVRHQGETATRTVVQTVHVPLAPGRAAWSSTIALAPAGEAVWVVNPDQDAVTLLATDPPAVRAVVATGRHPRTVAVAPDGQAWVANEDDDTLTIHAPGTGTRLSTLRLPYGSRPFAIVIAPDGGRAYVTLAGSGRIAVVDVRDRRVIASAAVGREPRGVAVAGDGRRVLVSCFLSPDDGGRVVAVDPATGATQGAVRLDLDPGDDTPSSGRGVPNYLGAPALSPDGRWALVTATKANIQRGLQRDGLPLHFENSVRTMLARVDLGPLAEDLEARVDFDNRNGAVAVAFSPLGDLAFIACQGNDLVEVLDLAGNLRQGTIKGVGAAPQGLVLDRQGRLWIQGFLSRTVQVVDVHGIIDSTTNDGVPVATLTTGGPETLAPAVLRGKRLFYLADDPALSFDGYISCAACHLDGRHDGRTWDFTDRGEGLRNTITLLGRRGTGHGPLHWSANFDEIQDFEHDIRNAFGGTGLMADAEFHRDGRDKTLGTPKAGISPDLDALAAYVTSLDHYGRSPFRGPAGELTADGRAGRELFRRLDCAACHGGADFTDSTTRVRHDVGTLTPASGTRLGGQPLDGLDTPTLRGLWDTAPYLHDGSAPTLRDVLTTRNPGGRHGPVAGLAPAEIDQLVAYLLQIDDAEEPAPAPSPRTSIPKESR